jgi:hypothetical protein
MLRVREVRFEDAAAIRQLNQRNAMGILNPAAWRETWEAHPFSAEFRNLPTGWVLETDQGSIVGNLDNIHMAYEIGGKRIKAAVAANWAVDREYRGKSLQLMSAFLRQQGVDLCLILSASPATARVMEGLKIPRIPIPDYAFPCFWAVRHRAFARAALLRWEVPGAALLAWPAGLALLCRDIGSRSGRGRPSSQLRRLRSFDDRFDQTSIGASSTRLRAVRTRAVLDWRFRVELREGRAAILASEAGGALRGYAVLVRRAGPDLGMDLYDVADLQACGDDASTIRDLLLGAIKVARDDGADALKFMSGSPFKRTPAGALRPYTYRLPVWQLYFKASSCELAGALATADAWDFSWFDTY